MAYGIQVFDTNGTTMVLGETTRFLNRMTDTAVVTAASHTFAFDATGLNASNSTVLTEGFNPNTRLNVAYNGVNGITITPQAPQTTISASVFVVRF